MAFDTPLVVLASLIVFILALLFLQLAFFRSILWAPLWISFVIVIFAGALRLVTVRLDRAPLHGPSSSTRQRHALRPLTFTSPSAWSAVLTRQSWETSPSSTLNPSIHRSTTPKLNARLDSIFSLVKKTLVLPWYSRTSPSPAFPDAVEVLVRRIMADLTTRAENVDWSVLIVSRILPLVKDHLHHYRSVEHLTSSSSAPSSNPALPLPLPAKPHSALSHQAHVSAGTTSPSVEEHLREWLKRILEGAMPEADRSEVVKTLAREVVLGSAMLPTFEMMCDSDFWNRQIDEKGGRYLHEQYVCHLLLILSSNSDIGSRSIASCPHCRHYHRTALRKSSHPRRRPRSPFGAFRPRPRSPRLPQPDNSNHSSAPFRS